MAGDKSSGRPRAPTITIDTSADTPAAPRQSLGSPTDMTASPTTLYPDMPQPSGASQASSKLDFRPTHSFESQRDSRPQSPHNVSSPVASRAKNPSQNFLAVPNNQRSRQNSVDSSDYSETAVGSGSTWQEKPGKESGDPSHDKIMNDPDALKPDIGKDADFEVANNPFAFTPGQLSKMFNPKSLSAFYALGGLRGIEKGLRSDRDTGLSVDEKHLDGTITFEDVTNKASSKLTNEGVESPRMPARRNTAGASASSTSDASFVDRKRVYTDNRIPEKKGKSFLQLVWITYNDKVLILLSVAAVVSLAIGLYETFGGHGEGVEWVEGVAIIVAITIVVLVGSLNDWQKEKQFAKLNKKKTNRLVKVIRSGKTSEISVFDIMSGDVLHLEPGDLLPVDGILINGYDVKCDESQATGESDIIRKQNGDEVYEAIETGQNLKKADPFIQSGARVMEGMGTYMATSTGIYSSYGKTLMSLDEDPEITPLQSKLNIIAEYIAKLGGGAGLLLFIVLLIIFLVKLPHNDDTPIEKGMQFLNIFIVVVTIIVVAVPEGLPLAVTLALAFATTRMIKDNNLVRHLKACEVMGNATTICSDKTGTLTQNKMQIVAGTIGTAHRFGGGVKQPASDSTTPPADELTAQELSNVLSPDVKQLLLKSISLNSTAFEGEVDGVKTFIGSKTETSMLIFAQEHLGMGPISEERSNEKILQLVPFDSGRKCMGIFIQLPDGKVRLYVKGASEIVLGKCTEIIRDPAKDITNSPLTADNEQSVKNLIDSYASRSLRTIGIIYRDFEQWPPRNVKRAEGNRNEVVFDDALKNMTFIGMVGIQDPLREGVLEAVRDCQKAGVMVRMVTGDNKLTAQAIAQECGILTPNGLVMEGPDFRNLSKYQQNEIIPRLQVLARSSPEDKRILVRRLKDMGETVAVTGDGTNDAPALKLADVGFSMGIAGTEVAKEASAIILMDDNFNSIVKALKWGRAVNDAVKKFLQFQLTVNITAVILTFVTAISNNTESSVLTAVQLLWVNLIMDTLAALALATDPPQDSVLNRKPERRGSSIISVTMWKMIFGQAIYQLVITFMLYYGSVAIFSLDDEIERQQRDTLVFNTFVWMQIFNQWNNRRLDNKFNIFEGLSKNWFFTVINVCMCVAQILIVFFGGRPFSISQTKPSQSGMQWGLAIALGFISIPIGMVIRLVPDELLTKLIPASLKRRSSRVPGLTVEDEERFEQYPEAFTEVRDGLTFMRRYKGGRLNNLKFAMKHPKEIIMQIRSPSHSRSNSIREPPPPRTPVREDSTGESPAPTPESRTRSRSMRSGRSRSNSALGATTVMAGIIASSVGAGWSPVQERSNAEFPPRSAPAPSPLAYTEEPGHIDESRQADVPTLKMPSPPSKS